MQLAPHVTDSNSIATPDVAVAEFEAWLDQRPTGDRPAGDLDLKDLLRVGGGR
jgi:hypothetical protein